MKIDIIDIYEYAKKCGHVYSDWTCEEKIDFFLSKMLEEIVVGQMDNKMQAEVVFQQIVEVMDMGFQKKSFEDFSEQNDVRKIELQLDGNTSLAYFVSKNGEVHNTLQFCFVALDNVENDLKELCPSSLREKIRIMSHESSEKIQYYAYLQRAGLYNHDERTFDYQGTICDVTPEQIKETLTVYGYEINPKGNEYQKRKTVQVKK